MAIKKTSADAGAEITIIEVDRGEIQFCILGTTPIILNRMSEKARRQIFLPEKKTAADRAGSLKHQPFKEFAAAAYRMEDPAAPTELAIPSGCFKGAMRTAALDMPGANKSQIGRLVTLVGERIPLWGIPLVHMSITRSSDPARTPDVRTRCIVQEWATRVRVQFTRPLLRETGIINLLAAAGMQSGVGDWRQEKGSGSYGSFRLVSESDPDFKRITSITRKQQLEAFAKPEAYDTETAEMLSWFNSEVIRRGFKVETEVPADEADVAANREVDAPVPPKKRGRHSTNGKTAPTV